MIFKNLWHKYSAEHGTRGALPNNDGTEFTIRIVTQANLGFRDFMKFQSYFLKFRSKTCVFFKRKSCFWKNWMLSTQALCGWIMFYSVLWLVAETWKKILHGRNGSNTLVNSKKSWRSKNHPSRDVLPKTFLECTSSSLEVKIFRNTCEWFNF